MPSRLLLGGVGRRMLAVTAILLAGLTATAGADDWPMARHDARRTGLATGTSDLRTPLPYWRQYLGGALGLPHVTPVGGEDVAYVGAGRLHVRSTEGSPRWSTENLALTTIATVADLDGDGDRELIARSSDRVFVFDVATGTQRWAEPIGEMGTIGDVRVQDLDGLVGPELVIQECYCCQVHSATPGVVYSFSGGWGAPPRRLWQLPSSACAGSRQMVAADFTGDLTPELVLGTHTDLRLLDGRTGVVVARSPDLGIWTSTAYCDAVDVLPGESDELLCVQGTSLAPGTGHRAFLLAFQPSPARLALVWSTNIGDLDTDLLLGVGPVVDLDGDGRLELTVSGTQTGGMPVTAVLDTVTGAVLATIPGQETVGAIAPAAGDTVLITQASQQIIGWDFDRAATPRLTLRWRLKDRRVLLERDWDRAATRPLANRIVLADVDGDGARDLFTVDTKRPDELLVYDARNPNDTTLRSWKARPGAEVLSGWIGGDRLVVSSSDGRLTTIALDVSAVRGSFRAGTYYDAGGWLHLPLAPLAAQLTGDGAAEVVVTDSRRTLLALDARTATNAEPPRGLWEVRSATAATIAPGLGAGGSAGLVCRRLDNQTVPATEKIARFEGTGAMRWEVPIGGTVWNDPVPGNFDGDAVPDVVIQWGLASDTVVRTTALAGSDGRTLWTALTTGGETRIPSGAAVVDWNGDGRDDVVFHHWGTRVLSGLTGAALATGGPAQVAYFMPTVADLDGDGVDEVSLSGGLAPARALRRDLATPLWTGTDDKPYPYAGLGRCGNRWLSIASSLGNPARLKVIEQAGASPGQTATVVLAGGRLFADEAAAVAAGATLGQLTSVHVHADLTGAGRPSAVVGSSDGWLYAIDPCTRTLDFAVPFGAPVGAAAFADIDDDGRDDLLVSVADGYLYGLRNAPLPGPGLVRDLEPGAAGGDDVDEVTTRDTLSASWEPVPGALRYEVAVAHADGGFLVAPAWQVVDATTATVTGLPLVDGERYVVAVRALGAAGRSPDILSDGVLVHLLPGPLDAGVDAYVGAPDAGDGGTPSNGGCCSTGSRPQATLALGAVVAAMLARRRRRR